MSATLLLEAEITKHDSGLGRRKATRHSFKFDTLGVLSLSVEDRQFVWLANLSESGLGFRHSRSLELGTRITVSLKRPGGGVVTVDAEVKHSTMVHKRDWRIGCEFVEPLTAAMVKQLLAVG